jgi:hypothetical protein
VSVREPPRGVTYERVCALARALPGVEEGTSYGTPGLKVRGKFLTRLREDGALVVKVGTILERDYLLAHDPRAYYITEHYREYPAVLVRLDQIREPVLMDLLTDSWRRVAPRRMVTEFDAAHSGPPSDL